MVLLILSIKHCNGGLNSEEGTNSSTLTSKNCFCLYGDLQLYVVNDKLLMSNLTEAFFNTGTAETKFLKITYEFELQKVLNATNNSSNNVSATNNSSNNVSATNSSLHNDGAGEIEYIWSQSSLYLLGPKALFWFTLSAVNIPESSVTIHLPCLCYSNYRNLLSRLTYMVSYNIYIYTHTCSYIALQLQNHI